jgi:hypothetical protein
MAYLLVLLAGLLGTEGYRGFPATAGDATMAERAAANAKVPWLEGSPG